MASCNIIWKHSAAKELKKLPADVIRRILSAVERLAEDPLPVGVRKLVGSEAHYRIRVGDYRVVYAFESHRLVIEIVQVGYRKDIYR